MKKRLDYDQHVTAHRIELFTEEVNPTPAFEGTLRAALDQFGAATRVADSETGYWPEEEGEWGVVYDLAGEYIVIVADNWGTVADSLGYVIYYGKNANGKAAWVL